MEYMSGDDDGSDGTGDDQANMLGALAQQLVRQPVRGRQGQRIYRRPPLPAQAQQPTESELRAPLGFPTATWAVADGTNKPLIVEPQETFRGERLMIDVSIPASVTNAPLVTMVRIDVGSLPQSPSTEFAVPAAMFRTDATYSGLDMQIAKAGTKITVTLGITVAPTGAGVVTALVGLYGQWIR
jgi:hypothetical protein